MATRIESLTDVRHTLASNVRRIRRAKGVSQEKAALEAGIDRTLLSKIERQITNPSLDTLLKLANYLEVHISDLFSSNDRTT